MHFGCQSAQEAQLSIVRRCLWEETVPLVGRSKATSLEHNGRCWLSQV